MRKVGVRALAAPFCAGLVVSVAVGGDTSKDAAPAASGWWPGDWFTGKPKAAAKKPAAKEDMVDDDTPAVDHAAEVRQRELKALNRRQAVCLRLEEIAAETHDVGLERQAQQLDAQAFQIYLQHTGGSGGTRFKAADGFTETKARAKKTKPASAGEDK